MSAVLALADNLELSKNQLPALSAHFYASSVRKLLPLFGSHEHRAYDFHSAVDELDKVLCIGFSTTDKKAFAYLMTALAQANRFGGDWHVNPELGENSAVHVGHCALLAADIFRRANLVGPGCETPETTRIRLLVTVGALIHDMGEILREITSVATRAANDQLKELPEVERKIFAIGAHLAYWAAQEDRPGDFYGVIRDLRARAKIGEPDFPGLDALKILVDTARSETVTRLYLTPENQRKVDQLVRLFDAVEQRDLLALTADERFAGYAVKVLEHIQGTRYFVRVCEKEPGTESIHVFRTPTFPNLSAGERVLEPDLACIPASLMASVRVNKGMAYTQSYLGELRQNASSWEMLKLARELRNATYETTVEWLNCISPFVDLEESKPEQFISALGENAPFKKMPELAMRLRDTDSSAEQRKQFHAATMERLNAYMQHLKLRHETDLAAAGEQRAEGRLLPVESRERLMALYWRAIECDYFPPPDKVLAYLEEIPKELQPLRGIDLQAFRQAHARKH